MALIAEFHPEARAEFDAALEYYELVRPGLGSAFLAEVQAATEYAQRLPQAGSPVSDELRRTFIRRLKFKFRPATASRLRLSVRITCSGARPFLTCTSPRQLVHGQVLL